MASRRKGKKFLIIALLAIIIAEAGYILYSFGLFSRTSSTSRTGLLTTYIELTCRFAGGSIYMCRNAALSSVSSFPSYRYLTIRIVDTSYDSNVTELSKQLIDLLSISRPVVDVYYIPQLSPKSSIYVEVIDTVNKTLNGTLTLREYTPYTIDNETLFMYLLLLVVTSPRYYIVPENVKVVKSTGNISLILNVSYRKPRLVILISKINMTFNKPINNIKTLRKYISIEAYAYYRKGNKTMTGYGLVRGLVTYINGKNVGLNIASLYTVIGNTTLILKIESPILVNSTYRYFLYTFTSPLIIIGDKTKKDIKCLIFNYNNTREMMNLVERCVYS